MLAREAGFSYPQSIFELLQTSEVAEKWARKLSNVLNFHGLFVSSLIRAAPSWMPIGMRLPWYPYPGQADGRSRELY